MRKPLPWTMENDGTLPSTVPISKKTRNLSKQLVCRTRVNATCGKISFPTSAENKGGLRSPDSLLVFSMKGG